VLQFVLELISHQFSYDVSRNEAAKKFTCKILHDLTSNILHHVFIKIILKIDLFMTGLPLMALY